MLKAARNFKQWTNQWNLFEDESCILRCRGRIANAELPYETKYPIIISKDHRLAELIVWDCHYKTMHRGTRQTLTELRANYWIVRGRSYVRKIIRSCTICKRIHGRSYTYPHTPDLPIERVKGEKPFLFIGTDHCGPLFIKDVYAKEDEDMVNKC